MTRSLGSCIAMAGVIVALTGCAAPDRHSDAPLPGGAHDNLARADPAHLLDRVTWGASVSSERRLAQLGADAYVRQQLHPAADSALPPEVAARIDAMTIAKTPVLELAVEMEQKRKDAEAITDDAKKKEAQDAYQQQMNALSREAATRELLRALYSPAQLQEQMTWFWMNHFNVHQYKSNLRALVGDYEERAIRPRALGNFCRLVTATLRHPAMIRYLDNEQNAAGHINENYARELLELHTLGVDGGYTQRDVQELARVLTGVGVNITGKEPNVRKELRAQYVRDGLFEYNPNRHDYGDKTVLGHRISGRGLAEVDETVGILCHHPATARFVSRKLAIFLVADEPPPALVTRMAATFERTDGDIAATLSTMFDSPEFVQSLGHKFKDPMHYVVSAVRLAYDERPILNANPMLGWLGRLGEQPYNRQTPDGYPMVEAAWASPGQMTTRFEIARAIGSGAAGLFKADGPAPAERAAFPQLANALYYRSLERSLSPKTREVLDKATSPQEWNVFLLSSPEFMYR
jgi:uncharacterized protein (DUF1800 family)